MIRAHRRGHGAAVLLSSALSWLAWPPLHLLVPSFVCLVPVLAALERARGRDAWRRRFALGAAYGVLGMAAPLWWMAVGMLRFRPLYAAFFPVILLLGALYGGTMFAVTAWIRDRTRLPLWAVFPFTWTTVEWMIGHMGPIAFPWLGLGTSLTAWPLLVQVADTIGARGVTFALAAANAALADAWIARHRAIGFLPVAARPVLAVGIGVLLAAGYGAMRMRTLPLRPVLRAAVVEPDHDARGRWRPERQAALVSDLVALSDSAAAGVPPDLVVWPENALPEQPGTDPRFRGAVAGLVRRTGAALVTGVVEGGFSAGKDVPRFNAALLAAPDAEPRIVYRKRFLIPAAEEGAGGLRRGAADQTPVRLGDASLGILICHESMREDLARDWRRSGVDVLVNLVNDAWFDGTVAPAQHAAHLVMRAIETRTGVVRAANSSEGAILDPLGRVTQRIPPRTRGWIAGEVLTSSRAPLYASLGDWVAALALAGTGALVTLAFALTVPVPVPAVLVPATARSARARPALSPAG